MIDVIFRHQGTVEQLIGDEIVALFGVPEGARRRRRSAPCGAAIDMVATVRELAGRWAAAGLPAFDIGVGISSGTVMAGTIGSDRRRELIVVGRAMIAAARIQRMTRLFDAHIIAGEETFRQVGRPRPVSRARHAAPQGHQAPAGAVRDTRLPGAGPGDRRA